MSFIFVPVKVAGSCNNRKNHSGNRHSSRNCGHCCRNHSFNNNKRVILPASFSTICKNCSGPVYGAGDFCSYYCGQNYHRNRACENCGIYPKSNIYYPYCSFDCRNATINQLNRISQFNHPFSFW